MRSISHSKYYDQAWMSDGCRREMFSLNYIFQGVSSLFSHHPAEICEYFRLFSFIHLIEFLYSQQFALYELLVTYTNLSTKYREIDN